jgi:hypothetical protein
MNKLALAGVLAFVLGGCAITDKLFSSAEQLCRSEDRLHAGYMLLVAPRRTEAQVAKAVSFHGKVQKVCAEGGTLDQIKAAIEAARVARD